MPRLESGEGFAARIRGSGRKLKVLVIRTKLHLSEFPRVLFGKVADGFTQFVRANSVTGSSNDYMSVAHLL